MSSKPQTNGQAKEDSPSHNLFLDKSPGQDGAEDHDGDSIKTTDSPTRMSPTAEKNFPRGPKRLSSKASSEVDMEATVPPIGTTHRRVLVLCFDGTGDQFDDDNSNVAHLFSLLKKDEPAHQLVYYQAGIGTYTVPQVAKPFMAKFNKLLDAMVGKHLNVHVMGGYEFLMQHYQEGDKICIFGFSRGAYTARALAGMVHKVGLLPRGNHNQVPFAYRLYSRRDENSWKQAALFKKAFTIDVDIEMIGVWDTVSSVGIIPRRLPFTTSNTHVKHFRHAVALDERRVRFMPNFWRHHKEEKGLERGTMPKSRPKPHSEKSLKDLEREYSSQYSTDGEWLTEVEEVWFAGVHTDVGGGSVKNGTRHSLARIPLRWMIRQCFELETGILFHKELLYEVGMDPHTLWPHVRKRGPPLTLNPQTKKELDRMKLLEGKKGFISEEHEDLADALCPTYDQLKLAKYWWILEIIPQKLQKLQQDDDSFLRKFGMNLGHPRKIPRQKKNGIKVHRSVQARMETEKHEMHDGKLYVPQAKFTVDPHWVD